MQDKQLLGWELRCERNPAIGETRQASNHEMAPKPRKVLKFFIANDTILCYITHDFFWENKKYIKIIQSSQQLFNPNEESLEETNSFSKRFRELILVGRILNYGDNKFIIIAMPLDSFYHFHVNDLPFVETAKVKWK